MLKLLRISQKYILKLGEQEKSCEKSEKLSVNQNHLSNMFRTAVVKFKVVTEACFVKIIHS